MNETIRNKMRQDLAKAKGGLGVVVGLACFFVLATAATLIPGLDAFRTAHDWFGASVLCASIAVGWTVGTLRNAEISKKLDQIDDDTLKYEHDAMSRRKLRSDIIFWIAIGLIAAYFLLNR